MGYEIENILPSTEQTNEDTILPLEGKISVKASNPTDNITVYLSVKNGTLILDHILGLTKIKGNNTNKIVCTGSLEFVNIALDTLLYTPNKNFEGEDRLTMTSCKGVKFPDQDHCILKVIDVNDPPINTVPGPQTVVKNSKLHLKFSIYDVDAEGCEMRVRLQARNGSLTIKEDKQKYIVKNNGTTKVDIFSTQHSLNKALEEVIYRPVYGFSSDVIIIRTDDFGNCGYEDNPLYDQDQVKITILSQHSSLGKKRTLICNDMSGTKKLKPNLNHYKKNAPALLSGQ